MHTNLIIPTDYHDQFDGFDTQKAIKLVKDSFEQALSTNLNLTRVSAPLFVASDTGLNDNLNGIERPVNFDMKAMAGQI